MRIISFVEGASSRAGGLGLVGVPHITKSIADQGHQVALITVGSFIPGSERFARGSVSEVFSASNGDSSFGVIRFNTLGGFGGSPPLLEKWAFASGLLPSLFQHVREADFVTLHSLYSFPVLAGYIMARLARKPYGLWPHGVLAPFQRQISYRKKWAYDRAIARQILDHASVLFFSAEGERDETQLMSLSTPSVIVPHGIDTEEYEKLPPRGSFRRKYFPGHEGPLGEC